MEDWFAVEGEARCSIGHQALTLGGANCLAQVCLAGRTKAAFTALGCIQRDHVVTDADRRYAGTDFFDNGTAFMTEDRWKNTLRVLA